MIGARAAKSECGGVEPILLVTRIEFWVTNTISLHDDFTPDEGGRLAPAAHARNTIRSAASNGINPGGAALRGMSAALPA